MPVSFKVVDNRTSISKKIKELEQKLGNFQTFFLQGMADYIVLYSPVDTGTYMESHRIGETIPTGFESSLGKEKNRRYEDFADPTLEYLYGEIAKLSGKNLSSIRLSNISGHAHIVEHELPEYQPYKTARRESNRIAQEAAIKAGG